jgi:hypothetical protein
MGEFDLSKVYLNELTCKVVQLLQTNEASAIDNGQDFLLNALVLKNPHICAPAACILVEHVPRDIHCIVRNPRKALSCTGILSSK